MARKFGFMGLMAGFFAIVCGVAFGQFAPAQSASGQSADDGAAAPEFEIAGIRVSPKTANQFPASSSIRAGRFEFRRATMVDLVSSAYGVDADKVLDGPSWLEIDKFDIVAKVPAGTKPDTAKLMLRSLLAERFSLKVHNDTKPVPAYVLTAGKKPLLKEAAASDDSGCKFEVAGNGGGRGGPADGAPPSIPTIVYTCHNMTMAKFAQQMGGMAAAQQFIGSHPVADQTGLQGPWDFSFKYNLRARAVTAGSEIVTFFDAMEKQLGLKLEPGNAPLPVLVVDSVNEKPTENSSEVTKAFPPEPLEFEVADIRPSDPDSPQGAQWQLRIQPGGRIDIRNLPLKFLIEEIWGLNDDMLIGAPKFMETDKWNVVAKAPATVAMSGPANGPPIDIDTLFGMLKTLMVDRFKLAVHTEERPLNAYTLLAVKPKMKKADPTSRTHCTEGPPLISKNDPRDANPVLGRLLTCQNISMTQFAAQLQDLANGYVHSPVLDATGLQGGWDFTLSFSTVGQLRGGDSGPAPAADVSAAGTVAAPEPNGAVSLNDAIEKQLGLKLETQKRPVQVLVIDHIEQKLTDN